MTELIKIVAVEPLEGYWLRLTFSDGAVKDVDVGELVARGGVFSPIRERREVFEHAHVNPESQTIEWPGEADLDPDVLYAGAVMALALLPAHPTTSSDDTPEVRAARPHSRGAQLTLPQATGDRTP